MFGRIEQPDARCCGLDPTENRRARRPRLRGFAIPVAAAACIALLFYVGGLRKSQHPYEGICNPRLVAQADTAKTVPQTETKKELRIEKGEMTVEQKIAEVKSRKAKSVTAIPDTLGNDIWQSERNVVLAVQMLSECGQHPERRTDGAQRRDRSYLSRHAATQHNTGGL